MASNWRNCKAISLLNGEAIYASVRIRKWRRKRQDLAFRWRRRDYFSRNRDARGRNALEMRPHDDFLQVDQLNRWKLAQELGRREVVVKLWRNRHRHDLP